ncbi:MAG: hypothetical protein AAF202_13560, partial [Pseudomonadota bacterium]
QKVTKQSFQLAVLIGALISQSSLSSEVSSSFPKSLPACHEELGQPQAVNIPQISPSPGSDINMWTTLWGEGFYSEGQFETLAERTQTAVKKAKVIAANQGLVIPSGEQLHQSSRRFGSDWVRSLSELDEISVAVATSQVGERQVYKVVTTEGELGYYIGINNFSTNQNPQWVHGREELIVSSLQDLLGEDLAPSARAVQANFDGVQGALTGLDQKIWRGVLSAEVGTHDLIDHSGALDALRVYDALLFSFLIGGENHTGNFRVLQNGGLSRIDFEGLFHPVDLLSPNQSLSGRAHGAAGRLIPMYYSRSILDKIKAMDRQVVENRFSMMSKEEIEILLFWRLVILTHAEEHPDSVI